MTSIAEQKKILRQSMRALLQQEQERVSQQELPLLLKGIRSLPMWQKASTILLYAPLPGEPDLLKLLESVSNGSNNQRFLFPRVDHEQLILHQWQPNATWKTGPFHIREPHPLEWPTIAIDEVDLALIPGIAFDPDGMRLGKGFGFFDRLLAHPQWRAHKVGIAWKHQIVPKVPSEPFDIPMDAVMTFSHLYEIT